MKKLNKFILKWFLIFLFGSVFSFLIIRLMPTTPVDMYLESHKLERTAENIQLVTRKLGLDQSLAIQYWIWLKDFVRGDWGISMINGVEIKEMFFRKLPYSLCIGISGLLWGTLLAFFLGYFAAVRPNGICSLISRGGAVFSQSVPSFLITILVIQFFSVKLKMIKFFTGDGTCALVAACFISAFYTLGGLSRVVCAAFHDEMEKSYVRFSVSRGFTKEYVLFHHASRPVICHLLASIIANFAYLLGGSTVLECAFAIPGVSSFLVSSMNARDYTVLQSYMMVVIIWMFLVHVILNLLLRVIDVRRK